MKHYMIVQTGGKQVVAHEGAELSIEKVEASKGDTIKLDKVLMVSKDSQSVVGQPYVKDSYVEAEVLRQFRAPKVISYKYIRREGNAKTKIGHRQYLTRIRIKNLVAAS